MVRASVHKFGIFSIILSSLHQFLRLRIFGCRPKSRRRQSIVRRKKTQTHLNRKRKESQKELTLLSGHNNLNGKYVTISFFCTYTAYSVHVHPVRVQRTKKKVNKKISDYSSNFIIWFVFCPPPLRHSISLSISSVAVFLAGGNNAAAVRYRRRWKKFDVHWAENESNWLAFNVIAMRRFDWLAETEKKRMLGNGIVRVCAEIEKEKVKIYSIWVELFQRFSGRLQFRPTVKMKQHF